MDHGSDWLGDDVPTESSIAWSPVATTAALLLRHQQRSGSRRSALHPKQAYSR